MFDNPLLNVAIGLAFFYALLSIIVTVIQEGIASAFQLRSKNLQAAIKGLLLGPESNDGAQILDDFYKHPLIYLLFKGGLKNTGVPKRGPSYIPAKNFARAIVALWREGKMSESAQAPAIAVARHLLGSSPQEKINDLKRRLENAASQVLDNLPDDQVKDEAGKLVASIGAALDTATQQVGNVVNDDLKQRLDNAASQVLDKLPADQATDAARKVVDAVSTASDTAMQQVVEEISTLFDDTMDRTAGWYKRRVKWVGTVIAILIAGLLNADSIYIAQRLWGDETLRDQTVEAAQVYLKDKLLSARDIETTVKACVKEKKKQQNQGGAQSQQTGAPAQQTQTYAQSGSAGGKDAAGSANQADNSKTLQEIYAERDCRTEALNEIVGQVESAGFPFLWGDRSQQGEALLPWLPGQDHVFWTLGILITAFAMSLGSSFWFDLLVKLMNLRGTGTREDTKTDLQKKGAASAV